MAVFTWVLKINWFCLHYYASQLTTGVRGHPRTWGGGGGVGEACGAVTFLPEKITLCITLCPNAWVLKSGCKRTQTARKTKTCHTIHHFVIQSEVKTKTHRNVLALVFPRLASATRNYFEFWLVHCLVCVLCDWLEWLLWCWFNCKLL